MRTFSTLLLTLSLAAPLACAKPPGPDASNPPASGDGGSTDPNTITEPEPTTEPEPSESAGCDFTADPNKTYVGKSPDQCATMRFVCEEGQEYFADDCGCGCTATAAE